VTVELLRGYRVLDVSSHGAVPIAGSILADWGADVVKVERPTGDPLRHYAKLGVVPDVEGFNILFEQFNRNKRSVAIDLRNDEGRAALDGLIAWADVFVTSFLPSAREKLRLRTEDIWAVNPRCIYAIGSGQGLEGPDADQGGFESIKSVFAAIERDTERIDLLVNLAGGTLHKHPIQEFPLAEWREVIDVNLKATFLCCQAVCQPMRQRRTGVIINTSSNFGITGGAGRTAYAAAKAAVIAFTKSLAVEMAPHGVRVNAIAPGLTATARMLSECPFWITSSGLSDVCAGAGG